jgi:hypothetical protein
MDGGVSGCCSCHGGGSVDADKGLVAASPWSKLGYSGGR